MDSKQDDHLINGLKRAVRMRDFPPNEYVGHVPDILPTLTEDDVAYAEKRPGFALPSLFRRLYLEVGNGGFGPGYGIFPLDTGKDSLDSIVTAYFAMRAMTQQDIDENWADDEDKPSLWPKHVLMICDWGCNIYSLLNCADSNHRIFRMDSNASLKELAFESASLHDWLEMWLAGEPLFDLDWDRAEKIAIDQLLDAQE